jgi:hypothetical protein
MRTIERTKGYNRLENKIFPARGMELIDLAFLVLVFGARLV